jgi:hypothetical protein
MYSTATDDALPSRIPHTLQFGDGHFLLTFYALSTIPEDHETGSAQVYFCTRKADYTPPLTGVYGPKHRQLHHPHTTLHRYPTWYPDDDFLLPLND